MTPRKKSAAREGLPEGYYDRDGKPITVDAWMDLWFTRANEVDYPILSTRQVGDRQVLAVWFGIRTYTLGSTGHPFAIAVRYHNGDYRYLHGYDSPDDTDALMIRYSQAMLGYHYSLEDIS
ncbi:hypothetical protein [Streptomyces sp. NBC_00470]|uniref:hypothetical protein n=1 Tax=Streptomyces sp. NBC_00470 TaxID=2975753 RepID=UPI0030E416FF